jgi:hypothetical protein
MSIKKIAALLIATLICITTAGCSTQTASNEGPSATPAPTPTPKQGIEAVFDKPVTLAIVSNGNEAASALFFEAATKEAQSMGVTVSATAASGDFDTALSEAAQEADAVIAFLPDADNSTAIGDLDKPLAVFETQKSAVPQGVSHFYYESDGELDLAFDAALTYPPHDTPVRLIMMFESADSPAYIAYQKLFDEGKIFPKEIYIAAEEEAEAGAWLTEKLNGYVEGMLDAVFAENVTLAANACDTLAALSRTDMEVFCPGVTEEVISRMQSHPDVFAQAVGRNDELAGVLCVRAALLMLHGEEAVSQAFEPELINAADLGDPAAMDSEKAALFNVDWMDTLRAYYSTNADTNE